MKSTTNKETDRFLTSQTRKQTDSLLLRALPVLNSYERATGAQTCTLDRDLLAIPEIFDNIMTEKNTCLYCMKYRHNITVSRNYDFIHHPCRDWHIAAMKKAQDSGGTFNYTCDLGFVFWTSPLYSKQNLIGAIISSGFLGVDREEAAEKMKKLGYSGETREKLLARLALFKKTDPRHIGEMAELMLICAESVSLDSGEYYRTLIRRGKQQKQIDELLEKMKTEKNAPPEEYPLEKEEVFIETVRTGNATRGSMLLNEILAILLYTYPRQFHWIQHRIFELAILLARTENIACGAVNTFSAPTRQFLKSVEEAENPEELIDSIHLMTRYLAEEAFAFRGVRHFSAIKKADRYIRQNFARKLSLDEIAAASGLSAPYFSTIFKEEMGENLSSYLNRLRVEKAGRLLAETTLSLTKIADACGFKDQSWFSKIYKHYTGINPGKYRQKKRSPQTDAAEIFGA